MRYMPGVTLRERTPINELLHRCITMAQIQGKAVENGENETMSTKVKLGLFNSQIVQHYITGSVFTNFAYMRSLDALKITTNECFAKHAPKY